jgi:methylenetetrahydrofolate reductase (NADPH)
MTAGSNLEKILRSGQKAVTCECGPPRGADGDHFRKKAALLKDVADAVNVRW